MLVQIQTDGNGTQLTWTQIVTMLASMRSWEIDGSRSPEAQAHEAENGLNRHLWFEIPGIDGRLQLAYRDEDHIFCEFVFISGLDVGLSEMRGEFSQRLAAAHKLIADKYATDFMETHANTETILVGSIPETADKLGVETTWSALTAIAMKIHELHEEIKAPLREIETEH